MNDYYLIIQGKDIGPYTLDELKELAKNGEITKRTKLKTGEGSKPLAEALPEVFKQRGHWLHVGATWGLRIALGYYVADAMCRILGMALLYAACLTVIPPGGRDDFLYDTVLGRFIHHLPFCLDFLDKPAAIFTAVSAVLYISSCLWLYLRRSRD